MKTHSKLQSNKQIEKEKHWKFNDIKIYSEKINLNRNNKTFFTNFNEELEEFFFYFDNFDCTKEKAFGYFYLYNGSFRFIYLYPSRIISK